MVCEFSKQLITKYRGGFYWIRNDYVTVFILQAFQQELGARSNTVQFVRKAAKELIEKSEEDTTQQQAQLIELTTLWDRICTLSVNKQERLEQAQRMVSLIYF